MLKLIRLSFTFLVLLVVSFNPAQAQSSEENRISNSIDGKNELSVVSNLRHFGDVVIPNANGNQLLANTTLDAPQTLDQNTDLYESLRDELSEVKAKLDELNILISEKFTPIAERFADDLVQLHAQLDSLKIEVDSLYQNDQLDEMTVSDLENRIQELRCHLDFVAAAVEAAYEAHRYTYEMLLDELASAQSLLQEVMDFLEEECPRVAQAFEPLAKAIQQQLDAVRSAIEKAYQEGSLSNEYASEIQAMTASINSLKSNAKEAEDLLAGIDDVVLDDQSSVSVFNLEGKRMNKVQKGLNIIKFANGTVKKVFIR